MSRDGEPAVLVLADARAAAGAVATVLAESLAAAPRSAGEPTSPRPAAPRRPPSTGPCSRSRSARACPGRSSTSGSATTASCRGDDPDCNMGAIDRVLLPGDPPPRAGPAAARPGARPPVADRRDARGGRVAGRLRDPLRGAAARRADARRRGPAGLRRDPRRRRSRRAPPVGLPGERGLRRAGLDDVGTGPVARRAAPRPDHAHARPPSTRPRASSWPRSARGRPRSSGSCSGPGTRPRRPGARQSAGCRRCGPVGREPRGCSTRQPHRPSTRWARADPDRIPAAQPAGTTVGRSFAMSAARRPRHQATVSTSASSSGVGPRPKACSNRELSTRNGSSNS